MFLTKAQCPCKCFTSKFCESNLHSLHIEKATYQSPGFALGKGINSIQQQFSITGNYSRKRLSDNAKMHSDETKHLYSDRHNNQ
jgi:hypothetical protein